MKLPYGSLSSATVGIGLALGHERSGATEPLDVRRDLVGGGHDVRPGPLCELSCPGLLEQRLGQEHRTSMLEREPRLRPGAAGMGCLDDDRSEREPGHRCVAREKAP